MRIMLCVMLSAAIFILDGANVVYGALFSANGVMRCIEIETKGAPWWKYIPYHRSLNAGIEPNPSFWFPEIFVDVDSYNKLYLMGGGSLSSSHDLTDKYCISMYVCGASSNMPNMGNLGEKGAYVLTSWVVNMDNLFTTVGRRDDWCMVGYVISIMYKNYSFASKLEYLYQYADKCLYSSHDAVWGLGGGVFVRINIGNIVGDFSALLFVDASGASIRFTRYNTRTSWSMPIVVSIQRHPYPFIVLRYDLFLKHLSEVAATIRFRIQYTTSIGAKLINTLPANMWNIKVRELELILGGECEL